MNENIMSQLPIEFLDRIKSYLSTDNYDLFLKSLYQDEKKGLVLDIDKLNNDNSIINEIVNNLNLELYYNNKNYNYYFYDETKINNNKSIGNQLYYHQGLYYVQEPSASLVIKNVEINDNDKILDLCAAPGGKSIDCLLNNKNGFVISNDIDFKRAKIISSNIERLGISNCIVTSNQTSKKKKKFNSYFDKVILDAPCSGEGMMRKNETARLQWNVGLIQKCSTIQKELIDTAYECTKDNGLIIYSTCTFAKEEDEDIIDYITNRHPNLEVLKMNKIYFQDNIGEGQFYAILKKNEALDIQTDTQYTSLPKHSKNTYIPTKILNDFIKVFNENIDYDITNDKGIELLLSNNKIHAVPNNIPLKMIDGLNVLRIGVELADIKNNTISLSHSISHSKYAQYFKHKIELSETDSYRYLKGESFNIDSNIKSFAIAMHNNIALGLCKITNNMLKNHYPKGLRILN